MLTEASRATPATETLQFGGGKFTLFPPASRGGDRWGVTIKHRRLVDEPGPNTRSMTTPDRAAAVEWAQQQLATLDAGGLLPVPQVRGRKPVGMEGVVAVHTTRESPLVKDVIQRYLREEANVAPSSRDTLQRLQALAVMSATAFDQANTADWADVFIKRRKADGVKPSTIQKDMGALARAFDWFIYKVIKKQVVSEVRGLILSRPNYSRYSLDELEVLKSEGKASPETKGDRDRRLAPGEEDKIARELTADRLWMFYAQVNLGLRSLEATRLEVQHVDVKRGVLFVPGSKGREGIIKPRSVPLLGGMLELMARLVKGRTRGPLFPNVWNGDPETAQKCSTRAGANLRSAIVRAGLVDLTPHDLRHEACCRWIEMRSESGAALYSLTELMLLMGWTSPAMVKRYASLTGENLRTTGLRAAAGTLPKVPGVELEALA